MIKDILLLSSEEIKIIQGYEGLYSITSFGRVYSHEKIRKCKNNFQRIIKAKFLKPGLDKDGYLQVSLHKENKKKTYKIHKLVVIHYILNSLNLPMVNHKNTIKQNCKKDNLEWCTSQGNKNHALINKLVKKETSKYYGVVFKKEKKIRKSPWYVVIEHNKKRNYVGSFKIELEAAQAYNKYVIRNNLDKPLNECV